MTAPRIAAARRFYSVAAALAATFMLAACAAGGPMPRTSDMAAPPVWSGPTLRASDGSPMALSVWRPAGAPRAVILAVHGYGDHAEGTFAQAAPYWAEQGVAVYAYDQRGFGRNADRGRWPGADVLIDDFAAAARQVAAMNPGLPLVAVGLSMGGGVVMAAVGEGRAPQVDAAILLAPAIAGGDNVGPLSRAAAWTLGAVIPDRRWSGDGLVAIQATDDMETIRRMRADPLYIGDPSAREIIGLIRIMDRAEAAAPGVRAPLLVLHGAHDELVEADAVRDAAAPAPDLRGVVVYRHGWHLLLGDLQKRRVWRDVAAFALAFRAADPPAEG
jgi:alpha-beta hydrolase superfamily lysophospholipase